VERTEVDLLGAVEALAPMLHSLLPSPIALEVVARARPHAVLANAAQLEQVVMNLVLNARDAIAGAGRITLSVDTVDREGRRWAVLSVEDTGAGMSPEVSSHVFEPFFTTKEAGKGTGLGLAVVGGVVRSHGGVVDVASRPGEGSRFTVYLPEASGTGARPAESPRPRRDLGGREHVLVVDDDVAVRVLVERVLTGAGYRVTLAEDGQVALERVAEYPDVRLVVTDLVMPRLRGDELARHLAGRVPVLFVSGYAPAQVAVDLGAHVLAKPFSSKELLSRVRDVLDGVAVAVASGATP
jgi:CheY-like chemotaxis protein